MGPLQFRPLGLINVVDCTSAKSAKFLNDLAAETSIVDLGSMFQ